jgi:transposase
VAAGHSADQLDQRAAKNLEDRLGAAIPWDSEAVRNDVEERVGAAAIPTTAARKIQHAVNKAPYAFRNRIERIFNRAKNSRRVAPRYDKLIESFAAFVLLTSIRIWIKFVHAT